MNAARAKNVVLIVFDYMGYGDIEPFGQCEIRTPRLRRLAEQGLCYTDCYAAAPICGPSRAAMLTGRYPRHLGIERNVEHGEAGLQVSDKTLARYFKDAGFHTALYGKWHLGYGENDSPNAHGFDDFLGFHDWNVDYYSHRARSGADALYHNDRLVARSGYTTDLFGEAAVAFIEEKGAEPFFLYVAYNAMLPPYSPPGREDDPASHDRWVNGPRADYVAAVEHLDKSVGGILDALDRQGLTEDTIVVVTFDHGGGEMATKGPFFHGFGTLWEGGIRVPMILRWPAGVPAGGKVSAPAILMDVAATLLGAAGVVPDQAMDGRDLLGAQDDTEDPRTLYWRIDLPGEGEDWRPRAQRAVRRGSWKYLWDGFEFLYDLERDPGERENLGYRHPDLLKKLRTLSKGDW
ncbi:MAG: sulfatase-like hydrolase/transferase [Pseudomonadota bacterium]